MSESVADDILRAGYQRWLRLEEEKAAIGDDLKELFAELKAQGFTPKPLRESFRRVRNIDDANQQEHDAIVDLYVASLIGPRARPAPAPRVMRAREENDKSYAELRSADLRALAEEQARDPIDWDEVSLREFPSDTSVKVYFVEAPSLGLIKIGSSGNVEHRIAALVRNGPAELTRIGVICGGPKLELELHERFAQYRVRGEWFSNEIRPEVDALLVPVLAESHPESGLAGPACAQDAAAANTKPAPIFGSDDGADDHLCDCADHAKPGEYYRCPKCDAEWPADDDGEVIEQDSGASKEQDHVDGGAARADHAGHTNALAGQVETRTKTEVVDGNASLAAREGEQAAAPILQSSEPLSSQAETTADGSPPPGPSATPEYVPAFIAKARQPLTAAETRPHCQNPKNCASYKVGVHCHTCKMAAGLVEAA
jgi:uncharacterized protein (UPF0335 family)